MIIQSAKGALERLKTIRCYALDMDGTIYLGDQWIPGAVKFLETLQQTNRRAVFLTNNSSKSVQAYVDKLRRMDWPVAAQDVLSSGQATVAYLKRQYPGKSVYLLGNQALRQEFYAGGIQLVLEEEAEPTVADVAVAAFDTTLDYRRMTIICDLVRAGVPYIATHPDFNCPTETGFEPDCGAIIAFIEASTNRKPDIVIGKPNREIIRSLLERTGLVAADIAIAGDRLYTDVAAGEQHGLLSILVLSGETKLEDLKRSEVQPRIVAERLESLIPYL